MKLLTKRVFTCKYRRFAWDKRPKINAHMYICKNKQYKGKVGIYDDQTCLKLPITERKYNFIFFNAAFYGEWLLRGWKSDILVPYFIPYLLPLIRLLPLVLRHSYMD
jgi:hypothetical protein